MEETYQVYSDLLTSESFKKPHPYSYPYLTYDTSKLKIAAAFASFNRSNTAVECVRHLQNQSRAIDMVVVGENASDDGTSVALRSLKWDNLQVLDLGSNSGNAGGVRAAMDYAFANGADAVWILDDESWPETAALEKLLANHGMRMLSATVSK